MSLGREIVGWFTAAGLIVLGAVVFNYDFLDDVEITNRVISFYKLAQEQRKQGDSEGALSTIMAGKHYIEGIQTPGSDGEGNYVPDYRNHFVSGLVDVIEHNRLCALEDSILIEYPVN